MSHCDHTALKSRRTAGADAGYCRGERGHVAPPDPRRDSDEQQVFERDGGGLVPERNGSRALCVRCTAPAPRHDSSSFSAESSYSPKAGGAWVMVFLGTAAS